MSSVESPTNTNFSNALRCMNQLEKAVDRLTRAHYFSQDQWPKTIVLLTETVNDIYIFMENIRKFDLIEFYIILSRMISDLSLLIGELWIICKPKLGKKGIKKRQREHNKNALISSINSILLNLTERIEQSQVAHGIMGEALEKAATMQFDKDIIRRFRRKVKEFVSNRGVKTYIFPCDEDEYMELIRDKEKFKSQVVEKLHLRQNHQKSCIGHKGYVLCGYRKNDRKTIMNGGQQETFPIRMIECKASKQRFSVLPSFLPREKQYGIEIIANVLQNILLYAQSFQATLQNLTLLGEGRVKSKQTIYNWIRWMGTQHPATVLSRAKVQGSGYFQEDEGFEKEPNLRTYTVVMVDPDSHLTWHIDYVDHVDEETLCRSFETFMERISFKVLGVVKDKWQASTNAFRTVCRGIWIGYCQRHCLKKFRDALAEYKKQTNCTGKEIKALYKKFKNVLTTSTSKVNLYVKIKSLSDEAFSHPTLAPRVAELKENAAQYTMNKKRKGIKPTTSIVDNYLKSVKRKLIQVGSFRDKKWAKLFFQAQANTRNFVPYRSNAKNTRKSPFMLEWGETFDLPWIQVMNYHNAFLFI